jgi:plasmid stabilization system protein ParE
MTRQVRWTTRAAVQFEEAAVYLGQARTGAGTAFVGQVEAILRIASEHPGLFPLVPGVEGMAVRRGLVRRYGYWVIYEVGVDQVLVLSIWHGAREPEGWRAE